MANRTVKMFSEPICDLLGGFFSTLAHRTRMRIFCALQGQPKPVTSIAAVAGISISNASQHLRRMRDNGAVVSEKQGQSVYYQIADERFIDAASLIYEALAEKVQKRARSGRRLSMKSRREAGATRKESRSVSLRPRSIREGALS